MSKRHFRKSIDSIRQQINIHYRKVADEQAKSTPDLDLINYWQKEIAHLEQSLARAEKRLRRG